MEVNTAQTVVKVFAVLNWIGAAFAILGGLAMVALGPALFSGMLDSTEAGLAGIIGGSIIFVGIIFIVLGIISVFVGRGLWQHKNWARIVVLVFAVLSVLSIVGGNVFGALIGALQIWLFGFDKTVKGLFTQ
jgi:hypothetical protein